MKPDKERTQELWERCGLEFYQNDNRFWARTPSGGTIELLVDLNNLFLYAVPVWIDKIMAEQECSSDFAYAVVFKRWLQELELNIPHAADALFEACYKSLGGKE